MASSSKRKSSKMKSSKLSSRARKMKKSRRTRSRKLGHRHDSSTEDSMSSHSISSPGNDSYHSNSDDDSISSFSTSSSEDTYRKRKKVLRLHSNVKKRRKQARRRSSSREGSRDLSRVKKRKRSKKIGDSKSRKNSRRKKLRRDDGGIRSASSDSHSWSEHKRVRRRSKENKKDTRDLRKGNGSKFSTHRSPSSHSRHRDESGSVSQSEETFMGENNSRRLRSVIIFAEQPETCTREENESEKDMQKEEIVYDHDDYPLRTSSGEGSKKVSAPRLPNAFDGVKQVENVEFVSKHGVTEPSESRNDAHKQNHVHHPFSDEFEISNSITEHRSNIPLPDVGSSGNDLEAILKKRALENLKKFRGLKTNVKTTADQKDKDHGRVNGSSSSKSEIVPSKLPKQAHSTEVEGNISVVGYTGKVSGTAKQNSNHSPDRLAQSENPNKDGHTISHPVVRKSVMGNSSSRGNSGVDSMLTQTTSTVVSGDKILMETEKSLRKIEPKTAQSMSPSIGNYQNTACRLAQSENPNKDGHTISHPVVRKSVMGNSSSRGNSGVDSMLTQTTATVVSGDKILMETEKSLRKTEPKTAQSMSPSIGNYQNTACSSAIVDPATAEGQSLNNPQDEAKDGSQYQQKTMSVVRGGEMVQVNYKVYIPKRAPALARRQLKR